MAKLEEGGTIALKILHCKHRQLQTQQLSIYSCYTSLKSAAICECVVDTL